MRGVNSSEKFDLVVTWNDFFHLSKDVITHSPLGGELDSELMLGN